MPACSQGMLPTTSNNGHGQLRLGPPGLSKTQEIKLSPWLRVEIIREDQEFHQNILQQHAEKSYHAAKRVR